jgi:hypothetical protein
MKKYTKGNMDILSKIKELQRRIEQVSSNKNNFNKNLNYQHQTIHSNSFLKRQFLSSKSHEEPNSSNNSIIESRLNNIENKIDLIIRLQSNEKKTQFI